MKAPLLAVPALLALGLALPLLSSRPATGSVAPTGVTSYRVDPAHSCVVFRAKHLGVSHFYGFFEEVTGSVEYDAADPSKSSVKITIPAESVNSNDEKRDQHLTSADFFSVNEFPELSFESTKVKQVKGDHLEVIGDLTVRGVTREVSAQVEVIGVGETPFGPRAGFEATFEISMADFDMPAMKRMDENTLGRTVVMTVALECMPKQ